MYLISSLHFNYRTSSLTSLHFLQLNHQSLSWAIAAGCYAARANY